jgi:2-oxoglutarate dehydrogenase E1 component
LNKFSYLKSENVEYIDEQFNRYLEDPTSIDDTWRCFFEGLELGTTELGTEPKVGELIQAYRELGRFLANINPLNPPPSSHPLLELSSFGLSAADLSKTFMAGKLVGIGPAKLSEILDFLHATYCSTIGVEYTHMGDPTARAWLQTQIEATHNSTKLDIKTKKQILYRLTESEGFERFLHTRYVAQKRFSLEGAESTITALDCIIETCANNGAKEFIMGMAHRGRLNVLAHVLGKRHEEIFSEFEENYNIDYFYGEGDVKYHKGSSRDFVTSNGHAIHVYLASNPSHLEFINPVVEGITRAKQDRLEDKDHTQVVPILIHGDAAFSGQGVCYETINLSKLEGYATGGTINIVINNQIGFTTSPEVSRSTPYTTDLAKMLESPVFHVNGDDPEAVWHVAKLAAEFRQKFKADAFIDLICYRRHGHNEGDEPAFTHPLLYKKIKTHPTTRAIYAQKLAQTGVIQEQEGQTLIDQITEKLSESQRIAKVEAPQPAIAVFKGVWKGLRQPRTQEELFEPVKTSVDAATLINIAKKINNLPAGFNLHPKLTRFFETRLKTVCDGKGIDWGNGETLAYASLLQEGTPIRLSGQDAERGTFTHRHSVLHDFETGKRYIPLNHISPEQAPFNVYNSNLSETGVMGFEYGYSAAAPYTLALWEAQFGDFANGAQVIIDQFISSSESKWQIMTGLILLLPHGYEGQGPEHSSARPERFLTLCGKNNMIICNLTTPAQVFHAIRRQIKREFRKPLVIFSPKSLLRHPQAVSTLDEFSKNTFREVLDDPNFFAGVDPKKAKHVLLCSGKVYYDLAAERIVRKRNDTAIVRVEQLYPWPGTMLKDVLTRYSETNDFVWVQEEPQNMGAWTFVLNMWSKEHKRPIRYAGRETAAAPAVGSHKIHDSEQKAFIEKAFSGDQYEI